MVYNINRVIVRHSPLKYGPAQIKTNELKVLIIGRRIIIFKMNEHTLSVYIL